jgi:isocitrate dehydrogenase
MDPMPADRHIKMPGAGEKIPIGSGRLLAPDQPVVGHVEGDGISRAEVV